MGRGVLVGIDLGAGSLKVSVVDQDGVLLGSGHAPVSTYSPKPGWSEQDPNDWWKALCHSVPKAIANAKISADDIAAISFSAGAHTCVLADNRGNPLCNAILWNDQRSYSESEMLTAEAGPMIQKIAGNSVSPTWTLPQLLWLKRNEPEILSGFCRLYPAKDWLRSQLTNDWSTDHIDAAGTLMFNVDENCWSPEICELIGWPVASLPPVGPSTEVAGVVSLDSAKACGLPVGAPVVRGGSDTAVEAMGAGMLAPNSATIKLATAATLSCYSKTPSQDANLISYPYLIPDAWYLITGTNSCASAHSWLRKTFFSSGGPETASYDEIDALAGSVPAGSDGLIFHPYLNGERSPYWDPKLRANLVGLGFGHGPGHIARAFYEGVAYSLRDCLELFKNSGLSISSAHIIGGGAQSAVWRQIVADTLDVTVEMPMAVDASYGAALLAGVGHGTFESFDSLRGVVEIVERNEPIRENVAVYQRGFDSYRQIQGKLAPIYHEIFDARVHQLEKGDQR